MQTDLFEVHKHEYSAESQNHLNENRVVFNKRCQQVFDLLMSGEVLTVLDALSKHNIGSFPTRIFDLKKEGVFIDDMWDREFKPAIKRYFMSKESKEKNLVLIQNRKTQ